MPKICTHFHKAHSSKNLFVNPDLDFGPSIPNWGANSYSNI